MIDVRHKAWAAGLFEGEGSISWPRSQANSVNLHLGMTDVDMVERFAAIVGVGHLQNPRLQRGRKPMTYWVASSKLDVLAVLDLLQPYFGERRTAKAIEARERLARVKTPGFCKRNHLLSETRRTTPNGTAYCVTCRRLRDAGRRPRSGATVAA